MMKRNIVVCIVVCLSLGVFARVPREDLFQVGGDLGQAVRDGFAIVFPVKMGPDGKLAEETERALDILPGGRKAIVDWQTDDPRAIDLYDAAMKRRPGLFEKCHIYVCANRLAQCVQEHFIWPRHMRAYRVSETAVDALGRHRRGEFGVAVRDAAKMHAEIEVLESEGEAAASLRLLRAVDKPFLPNNAPNTSQASVYARLAERDAAADSAWRALRSRAEYDAHRRDLRAKMMAAIGPLPERTPLNFRSLRSVERDGFRVEYVTFESMPGLIVPACLYVPASATPANRRPAVVISCGHGEMNYSKYVLAARDIVLRGLVAFVFEAYEQGERVEYPQYNCCQNHNLIGLKAMLLGSSMAALRIWDGMRAIDCMEALPYVDKARIGYMGQSGGGTMTALMTAADTRLKATAPSGYLTNFGYLCKTMLPQDAEQNIFGQLAFGLNHTGYVLIPDTKVLITGKYDDFFAYGGTVQLVETVRAVAKMLGEEDHYATNFAQGPHTWAESTLQGSARWMSAWLDGKKDLLPLDLPAQRFDDFGFDVAAATRDLTGPEALVLGGRRSTAIPGARSIHDILRDKFNAIRAARHPRTTAETAALVRRLAAIRMPGEAGVRVREMGSETNGIWRVTRLAFVDPDGFALPAVFVVRTDIASKGEPLLLAGSHGRALMLERAEAALAEGRPVLLCDVFGTGEVIRTDAIHYGAYDTPEEGISIMLYLMGESMIGRRAGDLLVFADWLRKRTGRRVRLEAEGSVAVAAAHAFAADRSLFADVRVSDAPPSWSAFLEKPGVPMPYRYTWCVNGALREYDWTELLEDGPSISAEIAACAARGGGVVTIPKGVRVSNGPVVMKSNVELHLEDGATIVFSDNLRDYLPGVPVAIEGVECCNVSPLVYAYGCTNVAITGKGTLKARMDFWWKWAGARKPTCEAANRRLKNEWSPENVPIAERQLWKEPGAEFRPQFLHFNRCKAVRLEDFAIRGSPFWTIHAFLCDGVTARNLDIDATGDDGRLINNSDGFDVDGTKNVLIENCTFCQGDDALVFKAGKDFDGRRLATPTENVVVRGCTVRRGHNLAAVGSELSGGVRNVRISDCRIVGSVGEVLHVKTNPRRGGFVENIVVENVTADELRDDVFGLTSRFYFGAAGEEAFPQDYLTPIRDVTIRNVRCRKAPRRVNLRGDYLIPVRNVTLENVTVDALTEADYVANVENLRIDGRLVVPTVAPATAEELGPADFAAALWQPETREYVLAMTDGTEHGTVVRRSRDMKRWSEPVPAFYFKDKIPQEKVLTVKMRREADGWYLDVAFESGICAYFTPELFWPFRPKSLCGEK